MKIAVIGIGGAGSAAARHLARDGHEVVGFEQFAIGHALGSSHGHSRIIRRTYPDLLYTQMMGEAYALWEELEAETGAELLVRCGGLYFGPQEHPELREVAEALRSVNVPFEILAPEATRKRFPALRLQRGETAIYQADSGFLRADRCVAANARLARAHGAVLHENTPVLAVEEIKGRVEIRTTDGVESFERAIVTAGAWLGTLFAQWRLPLVVTRQQIAYFGIARHAENFAPQRLPVWIDASAAHVYGFPSDGQIPGVKLASHARGETLDPNGERRVDDAELRAVAAYAAARLPDLSDEIVHAQACLYTNTPDEDFILDQAPQMPNVWLVSGCSGHGFKFTVLLGKIAAELATGAGYTRNLSRFSLRRFDKNAS